MSPILGNLNIKKEGICRNFSFILVFLFIFFFQSFVPTSLFAQIGFSYSYFNITRNNGGGTLEPGDIIEVHALGFVTSGTTIKNLYFIDSIRSGTQYVSGSMKIITNEGVPIANYTDITNDDPGVYDASVPGVRINIGTFTLGGNAVSGINFYTNSGGGTVKGGDVPIAGPGTLGIIAYRLKITASLGDTIRLGGNFYYKEGPNSKKYHFDPTEVKIIKNEGFCTNFSSASFTAESSFGSGNTQNRPQGVAAPGYSKMNITTGSPNDNYYSIVNNTSGTGSTDNTVPYKVSGSPRVFGAWDIVGDHTSAINPNTGNLPLSPGTNGGYMLLVNADYNTGLTYLDTIKNVCPNTYYEFSAWIRNLCGQCGADLNGNTYGKDPGPGFNDKYHGVMPNLTYTINDVDYYNSGNIHYTGTWTKRGFIYKTGPTETSFVIGIKNNASGGDGNDWVLDDINLSTCYPNLIMNPNDTATACAGYPITITDTVKSYYNNYGNYQWEASADGNVWFPIKITGTGQIVLGNDPKSITPVLINGLYEYHVDAIFIPTIAYNGYYFRLKVATAQANLTNSSCSVDKSQKVYLKVYNTSCSVLNTEVKSFSGLVNNNKNLLLWTVGDEQNVKEYVIEKSSDGVYFSHSGIVPQGEDKNGSYSFTDPDNNSSVNYYRLKIVSGYSTPVGYSKTILLYNRSSLSFKISTVNPFHDNVKTEIFLPAQGKVEISLYDMYGKSLSKKTLQLSKGNSQVTLDNVSNLPAGMYILTALYNGVMIQNKLVKNN